MTNGELEGWIFYITLTQITYYFSCIKLQIKDNSFSGLSPRYTYIGRIDAKVSEYDQEIPQPHTAYQITKKNTYD